MAKQLGFHHDASACIGCQTCEIACKDKNDLPMGVRYRHVWQYGAGNWVADAEAPDMLVPSNVFAYSISIACMHCADPACVKACPTTAMHKRPEDGLVQVDASRCVGCRYCQWACPYGAPQFDETKGVMTKCTGCDDLLAQGKNPACVDACLMRALEFGDIDELKAKYGDNASIQPLPNQSITHPSMTITPHKYSQKSGSHTGQIINIPEVG